MSDPDYEHGALAALAQVPPETKVNPGEILLKALVLAVLAVASAIKGKRL